MGVYANTNGKNHCRNWRQPILFGKNGGSSRKKSLKEIINLCLAKNLKANKQKTLDLFSKIQEIVAESGVSEVELQKSGRKIWKQLVNRYYQEK